MESKDFQKYIPILKQLDFAIFPAPEGPNKTIPWPSKKFSFVDDSPTHVTIQDAETHKSYELPLVLVEFANPGVLRVSRQIRAWNGSFV